MGRYIMRRKMSRTILSLRSLWPESLKVDARVNAWSLNLCSPKKSYRVAEMRRFRQKSESEVALFIKSFHRRANPGLFMIYFHLFVQI